MKNNQKRVSKEQKISILQEHFDKGTPLTELARKNGFHPITLYQWRRKLGDKPKQTLTLEEVLAENERLKEKNKHLTKALGNAHSDLELSKEVIDILKKKYREHQLAQQKKFSKKSK